MRVGLRRVLVGVVASLVIIVAVPTAGFVLLLTVGPHGGLLSPPAAEVAAPVLAMILLAGIAGVAFQAGRAVWRRTSGTRASPG